jgi:hypothetical protein
MSEATHTTTLRRRRRDEARELLNTLRVDNPKADRNALIKLYLAHIRSVIESATDPEAIDTLVLNPLREWVGAQITEPRTRKTREERAAEKAAMLEQIGARDSERIETIVTRRLLEWEMPDGRLLGDLTGADCRNLSERFGVFLHVLSDQMPARAKVRNRFTELELQAIARHHKLVTP